MPWIDRCVNFRHRLTSLRVPDVLGLLLPDRCRVCGADSPAAGYCPDCAAGLRRHPRQCPVCGVPFGGEGLCGRCQQRTPPFFETIAPFVYAPPVSGDIHQLKYRRSLAHGRDLGFLLAREIQRRAPELPEVLVPVPLHWKRQLRRGFNQSAEIAAPVSRTLKIPIDLNLVRRSVDTLPQVGLMPAQRRRNVRRAFHCNNTRMPESAAIVDDVVTSGSTASAVAHCLRQAGVERVAVWAVARV